MGQYTEGRVQICMDNAQEAEKLFKHLENLNTYVENHYKGYSDYYKHEIFHGKDFTEIRVEFSSDRYANCEWQGEVIIAESLPYYKNIIEFEFNIPNCESWFVGDEPEEWQEGGIFHKIANRIEEHRLLNIDKINFNVASSKNRPLKYQTPVYIGENGTQFCIIKVSDLDGNIHDFKFEMYEGQSDFWEGGQVGNLSFDLNYFNDEPDHPECNHIALYIEKESDGEIDRTESFLSIPLQEFPKISLRNDLDDDSGVPVKFVGEDGKIDYVTRDSGVIRLIEQFDSYDEFNLKILVVDREALAVSIDFDLEVEEKEEIREIEAKEYMSIHDFVDENDLEEEAEKLWGEEWEAEFDAEMAQELCDEVAEGVYVSVENNGQIHEDNLFEIVKRG